MNRAKIYLGQIKALNRKILIREQEVAELRAAAMSQGSLQMDPERVRSASPDPDPMGSKVARYADLQKEVDALILELTEAKHTITGQILQLDDDRYIEVLWKRYVELEAFRQIAEEMGCDIRHVFRIHGRALQLFEQTFLKMS